MNVKVLWLTYHDEIPARGYWDQGMLEHIFAGKVWNTPNQIQYEHCTSFDELDGEGAIIVLPTRYHYWDINWLNGDIAKLPWVLLILTGDEENLFVAADIQHPNKMIYSMTPNFSKDQSHVDRFLGDGWPPQAPDLIAKAGPKDRNLDFFFSGQTGHSRRDRCVEAIKRFPNGIVNVTGGFTQGMEPSDYYEHLVDAKLAVCPSGPCTVDTFRLFEALEAGCLPVADGLTDDMREYDRYWERVFGVEEVPFPVVKGSWSDVHWSWEHWLPDWLNSSNHCFAFWQNYKRTLVYNLEEDIISLSGIRPERNLELTVLMPTSPIPSHPSTEIIEETIASVRERLPDVEILVMIDGVRSEQSDASERYAHYVQDLLWKCNHVWTNVCPVLFTEHQHQATMTRKTLDIVDTENILFVEHDTPLCGEIDFDGIVKAVGTERVNLVRLHHETHVLDAHQHMMLDREQVMVEGVPMLRTVQWSQRPHVASVEFYKEILTKFFAYESRTMIEDVMHGVVHAPFEDRGNPAWYDFKLWMYAPYLDDLKRSTNLDGRKDDPKYEMTN